MLLKKPRDVGVTVLSITAYSCKTSFTANLQGCPGIFAGRNQVTGVQCAYAYAHLVCKEHIVILTAGLCS